MTTDSVNGTPMFIAFDQDGKPHSIDSVPVNQMYNMLKQTKSHIEGMRQEAQINNHYTFLLNLPSGFIVPLILDGPYESVCKANDIFEDVSIPAYIDNLNDEIDAFLAEAGKKAREVFKDNPEQAFTIVVDPAPKHILGENKEMGLSALMSFEIFINKSGIDLENTCSVNQMKTLLEHIVNAHLDENSDTYTDDYLAYYIINDRGILFTENGIACMGCLVEEKLRELYHVKKGEHEDSGCTSPHTVVEKMLENFQLTTDMFVVSSDSPKDAA